MFLAAGLSVLAVAVLLGGLAAAWRDHGRRVVPGIGAFALVAAAAIALLHLLPEAIVEGGLITLVALGAGLLVPAVIERRTAHGSASETTPFVVGYVAVLAHQAGEGTAIATLARTDKLSTTIVLAIAAHTMPLAMVVAMRAITSGADSSRGAMRAALALAGCALATIVGAATVDLVDATLLETFKPWLLAGVAGLLLHALLHGAKRADEDDLRSRITDVVAGLLGLLLVVVTLEWDGWVQLVPWPIRIVALVVMAAGVVVRGFVRTGQAAHDAAP